MMVDKAWFTTVVFLSLGAMAVAAADREGSGSPPREPESNAGAGLRFESPYDDVNWRTYQQYKMDSHAHARRGASVEDVVRMYDRLGYGVVSFKDQRLQYPLEDHVDDPDEFDITLLPGQNIKPHSTEEPYKQHLKLWFSETEYRGQLGFEEAFEQMGEDGGLVVFAHPASGMYPFYSVHVDAEWFIDYFDRYPHVLGIEINNHDMAGNLALFDELLRHYGADRRVVGFGVSDLMGPREDGSIIAAGGFGLSLVLSRDRDKASLREAIEAGRVLWIAAPTPDPTDERVQFPRLTAIDVRDDRIGVDMADDYERIDWIYANEVVAQGPTITLEQVVTAVESDQTPNYVRFEVHDGQGAILGSQGFYIVGD